MHNNPYLYEKFAQARQQELLREAEQMRLARLAPRPPSMIHTVLSRLHTFLVRPRSVKPANLHVKAVTGQL